MTFYNIYHNLDSCICSYFFYDVYMFSYSYTVIHTLCKHGIFFKYMPVPTSPDKKSNEPMGVLDERF